MIKSALFVTLLFSSQFSLAKVKRPRDWEPGVTRKELASVVLKPGVQLVIPVKVDTSGVLEGALFSGSRWDNRILKTVGDACVSSVNIDKASSKVSSFNLNFTLNERAKQLLSARLGQTSRVLIQMRFLAPREDRAAAVVHLVRADGTTFIERAQQISLTSRLQEPSHPLFSVSACF